MKKNGNIMAIILNCLKAIIKQNSKYATFLRIHKQLTSNKLVGVYCLSKTDLADKTRNNTKY